MANQVQSDVVNQTSFPAAIIGAASATIGLSKLAMWLGVQSVNIANYTVTELAARKQDFAKAAMVFSNEITRAFLSLDNLMDEALIQQVFKFAFQYRIPALTSGQKLLGDASNMLAASEKSAPAMYTQFTDAGLNFKDSSKEISKISTEVQAVFDNEAFIVEKKAFLAPTVSKDEKGNEIEVYNFEVVKSAPYSYIIFIVSAFTYERLVKDNLFEEFSKTDLYKNFSAAVTNSPVKSDANSDVFKSGICYACGYTIAAWCFNHYLQSETLDVIKLRAAGDAILSFYGKAMKSSLFMEIPTESYLSGPDADLNITFRSFINQFVFSKGLLGSL